MSKTQGVWTYQDSALVLIDYQKEQFEGIRSETSADLIELNVRLLARAAKAFGLPVVVSTVGVTMGVNGPTRPSILSEIPGIHVVDRPTMNAWEDNLFREAVSQTGRKRLIVGGLFTEICVAYPVVEALKDGYDVTFIVDAVGGMSQLTHRTAVERLSHAGAIPNTAFALVCELFRDWRSPVVDAAREIIKWYLAEVQTVTAEGQKKRA